MAYNEYQKMHYQAMYGAQKPKPNKPKRYMLIGGPEVIYGPYALLQYLKRELERKGVTAKIKPVK